MTTLLGSQPQEGSSPVHSIGTYALILITFGATARLHTLSLSSALKVESFRLEALDLVARDLLQIQSTVTGREKDGDGWRAHIHRPTRQQWTIG